MEMQRIEKAKISRCKVCGEESIYISETLGVCLKCIRERPDEALELCKSAHAKVRERFGLPVDPPRDEGGIECRICSNRCTIGKDSKGYCGLRRNVDGKIESLEGVITAYLDPLPTNCCAGWFCQGNREDGYNLAVFPYGCTFDCLFCQNWEHKLIDPRIRMSEDDILRMAKKANCVCYFGGTPEPQLPFLLRVSDAILDEKKVRICWEWNGTGNRKLVERSAELSERSGGIIKFDLKAFDKNLHLALTGRPNDAVLENFEYVANEFGRDILTATTLLVPGYVDEREIQEIVRFISSLDPEIPYSLLVFHPDFMMMDLPITPKEQAYRCYQVAKKYLKRVNLGNAFLLSE